MVTVPPRHYCIIQNPVVKNAESEVQYDASGQAKLNHADREIRLAQDPFPLFPGEILESVSIMHIIYMKSITITYCYTIQ